MSPTTLLPGACIGPYEILSPLGAGGMGEVYRARDSRLGRDVAIKVLPAAIAQDAERLHRFEQEARATAALNHPNILNVLDIGAHNGSPYIVTEFLDGHTLREALVDGALPVRMAVDCAVQVARGLTAAHAKGIVHRDLKPENLFLTKDVRTKILDFGLAKLRAGAADSARIPGDAAPSGVTTTPAGTGPGTVLGTVGYMAPEQVRGEAADHRTDLFALGLVLHEMLSGQPAFHRGTPADSMTAVLRDDPPDLPAADRHIAPALVRIVTRCLQKSPSARFQTAADLAFALESLSTASDVGVTSGEESSAMPSARPLLQWLWPLMAVVSIGFGIWGIWNRGQSIESVPAPIELSITAPPGTIFDSGVSISAPAFSVSPDGRSIAFLATDIGDRKTRVWVRDLSQVDARPIPNTEGAVFRPFWSPDSQAVAFASGGTLFQVDRKGLRQRFADMPARRVSRLVKGTWSTSGDIVLSSNGRIYRIPPRGEPMLLEEPQPAQGEIRYTSPHFLPDGRQFIFSVMFADSSKDLIAVGSIDRDAWRLLKAGPWNAWPALDKLLFNQDSALLSQSFDFASMNLTDRPRRLPRDARLAAGERHSLFEVGGSTLAYVSTDYTNSSQLTWFDRSGRQLGVAGGIREVGGFDLSRDGSAVVFTGRADQGRQVASSTWSLDLLRSATTEISGAANDLDPNIGAPGVVVFSRRDSAAPGLYMMAATGAAPKRVEWAVDEFALDDALEDGTVFYRDANQDTVWETNVQHETERRQVLHLDGGLDQVHASPDGRWLAYNTIQPGVEEVYVTPRTGDSARWQVSTQGGFQPIWRGDGREIFYLDRSGRLMSVSVTANGPKIRLGTPTPLFTPRLGVLSNQVEQYRATNDGQRFLVRVPVESSPTANAIRVIVNWPALLER